ncbi:bestrophin-3 [Caerostris extrusa]|uniref:Bestrophin homolog n=1 Tax=Caerostris extrusa TaxID=172846 RepID=A0AAV4TPR8_CAEEX|nr:bestrophin-3 [Caerostris extrusa]
MTVSYSLDVSKAQFCGFTKLLGRWKGSIYKILWREFLIFCLAYALISALYRSYFSLEQKIIFEKLVVFVDSFTDLIPLSFVLGFYVSLVIGRWWGQYQTIPWPDRVCFMIASYVQGSDERSRMIRRTLGRYVILAQALTYQAVSTAVKRRFPTTQHLVQAGIMTKEEQTVFEKISFSYGKWWIPCHWFTALATRARKEGRIKDSVCLNGLLQESYDYRNSCAIMFGYDWISVPLVYTQVVTIATYMYCLALIIGRQYLDPARGYPKNEIDLYIPLFTLLQFFFYVGWLKVAEQILNPYGEDDDDFELNWCLDRSVHIAYLVVDNLQLKHPKVTKDFFWDEMEPVLPQTRHSAKFFVHPNLGSAYDLEVGDADSLPLWTNS